MNFGGKEFDYYWKIIKIPIAILVGWGVIGLIIALISFNLYSSIFSNISGWIITIAVFGFIGYSTTKDHEGTPKLGFFSGLLAGAIYGFIGGIISLIMITFVPEFTAMAVAQAAAKGADSATIESFMKIGAYIGLITGPLFSGIIGGAIAWVGSLISNKF